MTILIYLPIGFLFLLLQSSLSPLLPRLFYIDLILIMAFFIAQRSRGWSDVGAVFLLGYTQDLFSTSLLGITPISLLLIFLLVHYGSRVVEFNHPYTVASGAALLEGVHLAIVSGLQHLFQGGTSISPTMAVARMALTGLFAFPLFYGLTSIERRVKE